MLKSKNLFWLGKPGGQNKSVKVKEAHFNALSSSQGQAGGEQERLFLISRLLMKDVAMVHPTAAERQQKCFSHKCLGPWGGGGRNLTHVAALQKDSCSPTSI